MHVILKKMCLDTGEEVGMVKNDLKIDDEINWMWKD